MNPPATSIDAAARPSCLLACAALLALPPLAAGIAFGAAIVPAALLQAAISAVLAAALLRHCRRTASTATAEAPPAHAGDGALVAMLAHELRTATSVLSLALADAVDAPRATLIRRTLADIEALTARCLQAARIDAGQLPIERTRFDLAAACRLAAEASADPARVRVDAAAIEVHDDPQLVQTMLRNLIDNALRYSPPASPVEVAAAVADGRVRIRVDNAVGAAGRPDREHVFDKYHRGRAAHGSTGAGLGLYLVARIAGALGGEIRLVDDPARVRFELWLRR